MSAKIQIKNELVKFLADFIFLFSFLIFQFQYSPHISCIVSITYSCRYVLYVVLFMELSAQINLSEDKP